MQQKDIIKLILGLTDQPDVFIELICDRLATHIIEKGEGEKANPLTLLNSLLPLNDLPESATIDPLHNKHINYISKTETGQFIESRVYFSQAHVYDRVLLYQADASDRDTYHIVASSDKHMNCVLRIMQEVCKHRRLFLQGRVCKGMTRARSDANTSTVHIHASNHKELVYTLRMIEDMKKYQLVDIVKLSMWGIVKNEDVERLLPNNLRLSENLSSLEIGASLISTQVFKHIYSELHGCSNVENMKLCDTKTLHVELGEALKTMTSMKEVNMSRCNMTSEVSRSVMSGLSHCHNLIQLNLTRNTLTDCLVNLFKGNNIGFPVLKSLQLRATQLTGADLATVSDAVRCGKLPQLGILDLGVNELRGCIGDLLGGSDHPAFTTLQRLGLRNTQIKKSDVKSLSEATRHGKLPQLKELYLSENNLSGCTGDLLGEPDHPGFTSLQKLSPWDTGIEKSDVKSLSKATGCGKLPELEELYLSRNNLSGCIGDLLGGPDHPGFSTETDPSVCTTKEVRCEKFICSCEVW